MRLRTFGGDPVQVSEVGLGCWQIGGDQWGAVSDADALGTLRAAVAVKAIAGRKLARRGWG